MTAMTPGSFKAPETSMLLINACGTWLRKSFANSIRGRMTSSANFVCPTHLERASTLRNGLPTTFKSFLFAAIEHLRGNFNIFVAQPGCGKLDRFVDLDVAGASTEITC